MLIVAYGNRNLGIWGLFRGVAAGPSSPLWGCKVHQWQKMFGEGSPGLMAADVSLVGPACVWSIGDARVSSLSLESRWHSTVSDLKDLRLRLSARLTRHGCF